MVENQYDQDETNPLFKFWYEKFLMRFSFVFAFCAFLGVFVYAFIAEVTTNLPNNNAPFSDSLSRQALIDNKPLTHAVPIDKPHRSDRELKNWINMVVSESLFFDAATYDQTKNKIDVYFTQSGLQQYDQYLRSSGILNSLREKNYRMSIFIEEQPLLMNGTEIDGVYRWLYQMPVTISFLPLSISDLTRTSRDIINRRITLRVQIHRSPTPEDPDTIKIESWTISARRN